MLKDILPASLFEAITKFLDYDKLYEIRLRCGQPILIKYGTGMYYFGLNGIESNIKYAYYCTSDFLQGIVMLASKNSIYSVNEQIKKGFITLDNGIRIGVVGNLVQANGETRTIKNFQALNIRIAHQVYNCSLNCFEYLFENDEFLNTLIISSPACGKTTFIRDICYQLSSKNYPYNVLIVDERGEICACNGGKPTFNISSFCDCISFCTKQYGFENGIRSMAPDIVTTDEIATENDINSIIYAKNCGVKVLATTHCKNLNELFCKPFFEKALSEKIFSRFIVLSSKNGPGTIEGIFDQSYNYIYGN